MGFDGIPVGTIRTMMSEYYCNCAIPSSKKTNRFYYDKQTQRIMEITRCDNCKLKIKNNNGTKFG